MVTQIAMNRIMIVASALMSGRRPNRMREKIRIGRVLAPGPVTKLAITRSSKSIVIGSIGGDVGTMLGGDDGGTVGKDVGVCDGVTLGSLLGG